MLFILSLIFNMKFEYTAKQLKMICTELSKCKNFFMRSMKFNSIMEVCGQLLVQE